MALNSAASNQKTSECRRLLFIARQIRTYKPREMINLMLTVFSLLRYEISLNKLSYLYDHGFVGKAWSACNEMFSYPALFKDQGTMGALISLPWNRHPAPP